MPNPPRLVTGEKRTAIAIPDCATTGVDPTPPTLRVESGARAACASSTGTRCPIAGRER
jgi:hypothetical protein